MRLYARIKSEQPSREAKKGANEKITIELSAFGRVVAYIMLEVIANSRGEPTGYILAYTTLGSTEPKILLTKGEVK